MTPLSPRALNRALLSRQMLLQRERRDPIEVVAHLLGLQGQVPQAPYVGLWNRIKSFDPTPVGAALEERRLVRLPLMRGTVHLVTAEDAAGLRVPLEPALTKLVTEGTVYGRALAGVDREALLAFTRDFVGAEPRPVTALAEALLERWPGRDRNALLNTVRGFLPLVQCPPRGVWGKGGQPVLTTLDAWLGRPGEGLSVEALILRYLAAFGPASAADIQAWSGLTRLAGQIERLRGQLVSFKDEMGTELFDLPEAPRPDPEIPAPPRLLADYDNVILAHAERSRILSANALRALTLPNGLKPAVLVDGLVAASWRVDRQGKKTAGLTVSPIRPLTKAEKEEVEAEAAALLRFLAAEASDRHVEIAPAD